LTEQQKDTMRSGATVLPVAPCLLNEQHRLCYLPKAFICARWLLREVRHAAFAEKTASRGAPQRYRTPTECPQVNGELGARRRTCNVKAAVHRNKDHDNYTKFLFSAP